MNIPELADLAVLLEAFDQRPEAEFDIVPVVKKSVRDYCTVNGEEVDTVASQFCSTSKAKGDLLIGER